MMFTGQHQEEGGSLSAMQAPTKSAVCANRDVGCKEAGHRRANNRAIR